MYSCCKGQDHGHSYRHACRPSDWVGARRLFPHATASFLTHSLCLTFPENAHSSSSFISIGAATLADIYDPAERGKMIGIFYAAPLLGPSLGPLLGGVLAQAFNWRASLWLLAALLCIDLMLFALCFRDTFRRERSLSYRRALARRRSTNMTRTTRDTVNPTEDGDLGDGPTSPSPPCGAATELDPQAKITPSLVDMNPFPPLLLVLRRRNNIAALFPSGTTCFPALLPRVRSLALQVCSLHLTSPSHSRAPERSPTCMTTTRSGLG
jgi:MFS family permease